MAKEKLTLTRKQVLDSEVDVAGKPVTFLSALLVLAEYPLPNERDKYAIYRVRKQVESQIQDHGDFVKEHLEACGGEALPTGAINFNKSDDKDENTANAKRFEEGVEASMSEEFEIYLDHKIEIDEIKNGSFKAPKGTTRVLSLPEISRLEPILAMPDDMDDDSDPVEAKATRE